MQIEKCVVTPVELSLKQPVRMSAYGEIESVTAVFVRIETRPRKTAWGCAIAHPDLTGESPADVVATCQECAKLVPDLHPTNIEYSLAALAPFVNESPCSACAFDMAFHDLLGLVADMPVHRLLGGYRDRIQTSVTIPIASVKESVESACGYADQGFRMLKIKGGLDADLDVQRVRAIQRVLPDIILRLDADGCYDIQSALNVSRALEGKLEMIEQPTSPDDQGALQQITRLSPIPILADQSVTGPESALKLASERVVDGLSVKVATSGGLRRASQVDAIARAAQIATMVGCVIEPALLIAAGLYFALSSPNVRYVDLDGHLELINDPTVPGFELVEGWLIASDVPGLGCTVEL